jgi:plasmid stabilization system protein ParE
MKRFPVIFSRDAVEDLASSIQWGVENWGEENAWHWYRGIRNKIQNQLSFAPSSCPIAPDNDEYEVEVRQMIAGRYRVLFHIGKKEVTILHIKGPYTGTN